MIFQSLILGGIALFSFSSFAAPSPKLQPQSVNSKPSSVIPKDRSVLKMGQKNVPDEKVTYAKVIQAYRQDDLKRLSQSNKVLLRNFPQSIYADNSLYLAGILLMKKKKVGKSD